MNIWSIFNAPIGLYVILGAGIIFIWLYWFILKRKYGKDDLADKDILNKKLFELPCISETCCSSWKLLHFLLFLIVGFLYPQHWKLITILGIAWELYEVLMSKIMKRPYQISRKNNQLEYQTNWWAGSFSDILFNSAGLLLGLQIRKMI
jgi:hypothetical protein